MIDQDAQLKLQSYLDGELPAREAAKVRDWVARDQEAQTLLEALRGMNTVLAGHEAECKLPESREFYWSKIQREIERQPQPEPVRRESWLAWLQRHVMPVAGMALVVGLCGFLALHSGGPAKTGEMELASDGVFPRSNSVNTEEQASAVTHPLVRNRASAIRPASTRAESSRISPHTGFSTETVAVAASRVPAFRGF